MIKDRTRKNDFTFEGGVADSFRLLKTIMGFWLIQECRRKWWNIRQKYSCDDITKLARTRTLEKLEKITGRDLKSIHVMGGGSKNRFLNKLNLSATGCKVISGPIEASAFGHILVQAISLGELVSLAEDRELVRTTFSMEEYLPEESAEWDEAYQHYLHLRKKGSY